MADKDRSKKYAVGYKKPPKEHQFKKGKPSPNPRGRRKKLKNMDDLLVEGLGRKITVTENGAAKKMLVQEAIIHRLLLDAMRGKNRALNQILKLLPEPVIEEEPEDDSSAKEAGLALLEERIDKLSDDELKLLLKIYDKLKVEY